jgi:hypothetical protein
MRDDCPIATRDGRSSGSFSDDARHPPPAAAIVPLRSLDRAARDRDARAGVTHHHVDLSDAVTATDHVP